MKSFVQTPVIPVIAILLTGTFAFAKDTKPAFKALKDLAVDYSATGQICEQVARLELAETYSPADYDITVGVEYSVGGRTIGELDIVVVDKHTNNVSLVAEVKCWRSISGGLKKAKQQRTRFVRTLSTQPDRIVFDSKEGGSFASNQFIGADMAAIAQNGSVANGFDIELSYSLTELMRLRSDLMNCQARGLCAAP